jgi:hypothetical protein
MLILTRGVDSDSFVRPGSIACIKYEYAPEKGDEEHINCKRSACCYIAIADREASSKRIAGPGRKPLKHMAHLNTLKVHTNWRLAVLARHRARGSRGVSQDHSVKPLLRQVSAWTDRGKRESQATNRSLPKRDWNFELLKSWGLEFGDLGIEKQRWWWKTCSPTTGKSYRQAVLSLRQLSISPHQPQPQALPRPRV